MEPPESEDAQPIVIRLDGRDPLCGSLAREGSEDQRFVGWLGLLSLLEATVSAHAEPSPGPSAER